MNRVYVHFRIVVPIPFKPEVLLSSTYHVLISLCSALLLIYLDGSMIKRSVDFSTIVDLLQWRAFNQPHQISYNVLIDGEMEENRITYRELDQQSRSIGALLQSLGLVGQRILLLYPPGLSYIAAFYGCLYAGSIAVPLYPPRLNRSVERLQSVIIDCQAAGVLTTRDIINNLGRNKDLKELFGNITWIATDNSDIALAEMWQQPEVSNETLAFLQYTSGSTATPKGVMLTHDNLLQNLTYMNERLGLTSSSRGVVWLPPYHDMGLIGGILQPLFGGFPVTLIPPAVFIQRPICWLQAVSHYRGTISGGPNFAYDLCIRKITPDQRIGLDLSWWVTAFTGAEPIRYETMKLFATVFEDCGFNFKAFYPCYGLAEATLFVAGNSLTNSPVVRTFQKSALEYNQAIEVPGDNQDAQVLVSCGKDLSNQGIAIVDPEARVECRHGRVGEIWVTGPDVAQGYWNNPELTKHTFHARLAGDNGRQFLRTGDLGFIVDDELFITGRLKDLILIRGRNHYPQDIELTVEQCHPAFQPGCCAAFSCEIEGEERLVVAQEVKRESRNPNVEEIAKIIRQSVALEHELQVYAVLLLRFGSIPKTSSGKIQRHLCRTNFMKQSLKLIGQSIVSEMNNSAQETVLDDDLTYRTLLNSNLNEQLSLLEGYLQRQIARTIGVQSSQIDIQMPLSALALDSLMALEIQADIETRFGVVFPLMNFLSRVTLTQVASDLLAQLGGTTPQSLQWKTEIQEKRDRYPLSYGQNALWFAHNLSSEVGALNIAKAVKILGQLDLNALRTAFQSLIHRHSSLRTTFAVSNGIPFQRIHESADLSLQVTDATTWDEDILTARLDDEAYRPIDLLHGPLLQLHIFIRTPQEHVLLFVVHHIAVDFWSLATLVEELIQQYTARKIGMETNLPVLAIQYTDFVHWQNEILASSMGENLWRYWQKQLSGELPLLNLPIDRPRSANLIHESASQNFKIDVELTKKLMKLANTEGVTPYMLLLSVFQVLLHRYTGQEDIVIGTPASGRSFSALRKLIGYFVNPVAIRVNLSEEQTFRDFLVQVRHTVVDAFEHQNFPFALLIERLQPTRDPHRSQFFTVVFNWLKAQMHSARNLEAFALDEPGVRIQFGTEILEPLPLKREMTQFDLELTMAEVEKQYCGQLKYNPALFQSQFITSMLDHFRVLLENVVADPNQKVTQLSLLTQSEQYQLLTEWNDYNDYAQERCIHQLFEMQAAQQPEALALSCMNERLTYAELNAKSNQLAYGLLEMGIAPGQPVALMLKNSSQYIASLLAILKAGGVFVCLDANYPGDRIRQILEEVRPSLLIGGSHELNLHCDLLRKLSFSKTLRAIVVDAQADQLTSLSNSIVCIETAQFTSLPLTNPTIFVRTGDPAYIAYTSGSTGKPKGIVHTHQSFCQFIEWQSKQFDIKAPQRVAQMAPTTFDVSYCEIFGTLCFGAILCLVPAATRSDPEAFVDWMYQEKITLLQVVPSYFSQMLRSIEEKNINHTFADLLFVLFVGEALPPAMMQKALSILPKTLQFFNVYGPTEAVAATCYKVRDVDVQRSIPIGQAIHGRQILILDKHKQLCPIGVKGEIYIRSSYLAVGYFQQKEATEKAFVQNPLHNAYPDRVYHTGDLGRWLPDGNIEYGGRVDNQIKLRGIRIELEDIEFALLQHKLVRECAVLTYDYGDTDQRLIAYVVTSDMISQQELRIFLKGMLPSAMIPSAFIFLETLPHNPNGKLDRKALPLPILQIRSIDELYQAPQTPIELLVASMWCILFQVDQVGVYDSFFDLGGHSLLAMQVTNRLRQLTSVEFPLHTFLDSPTVAHLTTEIMQKGEGRLAEKINQVVAKVERFSDDEVLQLLQQKRLRRSIEVS